MGGRCPEAVPKDWFLLVISRCRKALSFLRRQESIGSFRLMTQHLRMQDSNSCCCPSDSQLLGQPLLICPVLLIIDRIVDDGIFRIDDMVAHHLWWVMSRCAVRNPFLTDHPTIWGPSGAGTRRHMRVVCWTLSNRDHRSRAHMQYDNRGLVCCVRTG